MEVTLYNRQRAATLPLERLLVLAQLAADECIIHPGVGQGNLDQLDRVEISLVSDRVIARVHRQFLGLAGPTDVITFDHGEIVISVATAARQARENGESIPREVARYIVHGFLHLAGHADTEPGQARVMWQAQERILDELWPCGNG